MGQLTTFVILIVAIFVSYHLVSAQPKSSTETGVQMEYHVGTSLESCGCFAPNAVFHSGCVLVMRAQSVPHVSQLYNLSNVRIVYHLLSTKY